MTNCCKRPICQITQNFVSSVYSSIQILGERGEGEVAKSLAMKVRIADELPIVPLGGGNLMGKVLVSLADNVGFSMYEFYAKPGDEVTLAAFHPNHNHIYYCPEGMWSC